MLYLKAYQAYFQQNYDQCLKFLLEIKQNDAKKLDLLAQVYFRTKDYQKAYDIYVDLIAKGGEFVKERKENLTTLIVCAQLERPGSLKTKGGDKIPTAEQIVEQVESISLKDESVYDLFSGAEPSKRGKKHKKRRKRLPKQYDPVAGPDPERWLPMRDRKSSQKQKKRRSRPNPKGGKTRPR